MNREKQHDLPLSLKAAIVLDQLRERIRWLHNSIRTEGAYVYWVRVIIWFLVLSNGQTWGLPSGA